MTVLKYKEGGTWKTLQIGPEVYEQPSQPTEPIGSGAIWIDTDAPDPTPGAAAAVPTGSLLAFAGVVAPAGYLFCDGTLQSRTTFATLFGVIGTRYGIGDGSTTFNLPDLRGRVAVGQGTNVDTDTIGEYGGPAAEASRTPRHQHRHVGQNAQRQSNIVVQSPYGSSGNHPNLPGAKHEGIGPIVSGASYELPNANNDILLPTIITSDYDGPAYLVVTHVIKA